ncbi:unnamed protein product [Rhodiola kirilowii]
MLRAESGLAPFLRSVYNHFVVHNAWSKSQGPPAKIPARFWPTPAKLRSSSGQAQPSPTKFRPRSSNQEPNSQYSGWLLLFTSV